MLTRNVLCSHRGPTHRRALRASVVSNFVVSAVAVLASVGPAFGSATAQGGAGAEGREAFQNLKCSLCHAVPAAGIEAKAKSEKVKGADLGEAEPVRGAEELASYLRQETELDGKRHKKEFKGSDEELQAIVAWLTRLSEEARAASSP